ncbi:DUF982 domain-containing protein [Mesorhizobium sp. M0296]|uniref:DUF982 domain-containing protein n=1 Tax=Mesorhizobium sp. M0296 TaxID=2956931 RepID=UPI00333CD7E9
MHWLFSRSGGTNEGRGFRQPHYIVQEIASLAEAIDLLDEWPQDRRDRAHDDEHKPVGTARDALYVFAKQVGILEDATSAMQWIAACKAGTAKV